LLKEYKFVVFDFEINEGESGWWKGRILMGNVSGFAASGVYYCLWLRLIRDGD
jgi:hypothetical protein